MNEEWENRLIELEIKLALQDELLASLSDTIAQLRQAQDLQQAQLRLLYQRVEQNKEGDSKPYSLLEEVPPHY